MTAKENVSFAEAPADLKTPRGAGARARAAAGFAEAAAAEDVAQQFKMRGTSHSPRRSSRRTRRATRTTRATMPAAACKRVSRRQHARPERFGEFKSWNSVQTTRRLGTPGHGLLSKQAKLRWRRARRGKRRKRDVHILREGRRRVGGGGEGEGGEGGGGGGGGGGGDAHDGALQRGGIRRGGARGARARRGADAHGGRGAPRGGPRGCGGSGEREARCASSSATPGTGRAPAPSS